MFVVSRLLSFRPESVWVDDVVCTMFDAETVGDKGEFACTVVIAVGGIIIRNGFKPDNPAVLYGLMSPSRASIGMPTRLIPHAASTPNRIASSGVIVGEFTESDVSVFGHVFFYLHPRGKIDYRKVRTFNGTVALFFFM